MTGSAHSFGGFGLGLLEGWMVLLITTIEPFFSFNWPAVTTWSPAETPFNTDT
jgi:hypothetical protein